MANISIQDLHPAGSDLFLDSESYLNEVTDLELIFINGGASASEVGVVGGAVGGAVVGGAVSTPVGAVVGGAVGGVVGGGLGLIIDIFG
jgi:hypothetical protein